jgi:ankyrin repeat protein
VGSLEEPFSANVYCVDLKDNRITMVLNSQDKTGTFNPELEWTEKGIVITCRDSIYYGSAPENIRRLEFKDKVKKICQGRLNRDGNAIVFAAEKDKRSCLLVFDIETGTLTELKILKNKPENYQFAWVKQNEKTVIRNEADSCILSGSLLQYEIIGDLFSDSYYSFYDTACAAGRNDLVLLIIKLSGNINSADLYKRTFLTSAVRFHNNNITDYLLNNGADVNLADSAGWTPLHYAAENNDYTAMEMLIAHQSSVSCRSNKFRFTKGKRYGKKEYSLYQRLPLELVDWKNHFFENSSSVQVDKGLTPLHLLAFDCKSPLKLSLSQLSTEESKMLKLEERFKCMKLLAEKGANINSATDSGMTPLHFAVFSGSKDIAEFLLKHGANPNMKK